MRKRPAPEGGWTSWFVFLSEGWTYPMAVRGHSPFCADLIAVLGYIHHSATPLAEVMVFH